MLVCLPNVKVGYKNMQINSSLQTGEEGVPIPLMSLHGKGACAWSCEQVSEPPICPRTGVSHQTPAIAFAALGRYFPCQLPAASAFYGLGLSTFPVSGLRSVWRDAGRAIELSESDKNDMMAPKCPPISPNGLILISNMTDNKIGPCVFLEVITLLEAESPCNFIVQVHCQLDVCLLMDFLRVFFSPPHSFANMLISEIKKKLL